ncbi:FemAB family XrtA/PEP-CTERM system-associated protein [Parvularcula sp. LCG005]|uniref:FemAB family XrtA/PEP-CTERM system-associated protein n=1 Tax=Parvularcula sp. LCG005 TaxID=3078805 RepID=UPI00294271BC|nr:FemAB family XrtA/PEP-CTERM system-associated protein [Parvularcula sp. LCG005]WOI52522.1 FemAB family PEP-CTERM system-associated protein [Parvularcula sp. LCG005]
MSGVSVRQATPADAARWDAYAARGSFFHRFGWGDVVRQAYGQSPIYLYAERDGQIAGILPLIDRRSMLLGRALISVGFTTGGGVIADDDDEARRALLDAAEAEATRIKADYIELRSPDQHEEGWHEKAAIYDAFTCPILPDEDSRLKAIPRKKRADIRKAIAMAEEGRLSAEQSADMRTFWLHFAEAQRNLGTPVFPRQWLEAQKAAFGDAMELTLVRAGSDPLCGVISYYHGDTVILYNAFISPRARAFHAGDYLYWWMLGHAAERGCTTFDLGRSKRGTGSHAYKTFWGIEPQPMTYLYKLLGAEETPNVNPQNPKFALLSQSWKHLPMPIATRLGPMLARHLA